MKNYLKLLSICLIAALASCSKGIKPESTNVKGENTSDARVVTLSPDGATIALGAEQNGKCAINLPVEFVLEKTEADVEKAEATLKLTTSVGVKELTLSADESESLGFFISANARGDKKAINFTADIDSKVAQQLVEAAKSYRIEDFKLIRKGEGQVAAEAPAAEQAPAPKAEKPAAKPAKNELKEMAQTSAPAPAPEPSGQTWRGTIKGAGGITMYINSDTGEFWYYYNKIGSKGKLYLTVMTSSGNFLELYEQNKYGEVTGVFSGTLRGNSYSGTFTNYKGRQFPFNLHR